MNYYKYAAEQYQNSSDGIDDLWRERLAEWREENSLKKLDSPTRIPKARKLGYKSKRGFNVVRVRVMKGGTKRRRNRAGRRPKRAGQSKYSPGKSKRVIAEERASDKYSNLEVLNSYWVAEDGNHKWFEVLTVDPEEPTVKNDDDINWICDQRNRVERGLTPAAKESRGHRKSGKGSEKVRPSNNANEGRAN